MFFVEETLPDTLIEVNIAGLIDKPGTKLSSVVDISRPLVVVGLSEELNGVLEVQDKSKTWTSLKLPSNRDVLAYPMSIVIQLNFSTPCMLSYQRKVYKNIQKMRLYSYNCTPNVDRA